jgi:2',3'-cyclic-nucleotide 2'-phosphodiesterase/3'-nucleotidase
MKSKNLRIFLCISLLLPIATTAAAQDTAQVVIAATTDVHGRAYHWNYVTDSEAAWGLTRVATVIDSLRARYPGQVVVVDVGDLIQGNSFASYYASERPGEPHRVIDALNAVEYDVATLGNHDFDFGYGALRRALADAAYPVVSANVYRLPRDTFAFQPEVMLSRGGVSVGVTGLTTPGVMVWHGDKIAGQAYVRRILPSAGRAMRRLQAAGADLRIAAVHSGMGLQSSYDTTGVGPENVAAQLAHLPIKPHVVLVGHSHARITDMVIDGVHFFQPSPWALSLAVVHVILVGDQDRGYRVVRVVGEEISVADVEPHPAVVRRLERAHQSVREWVGTTIATVREEWGTRFARAEDTPIIDFVNEVQKSASGADLSATPAFDPNARLGPNAVSMRDVAGIYPHENTLKAVLINGETLRQYLERSAEYFLEYRPGAPIVNDTVPGYDFDIVSGVDYTIDLTQPAGSRVRQITRGGELVGADDILSLALNSYRQGGGGGFAMLRDLPVVYDQGEDIRDLLIEAIRRAGHLRVEDYFDPSWSIVPPEAAEAVRGAFDVARPVAPTYLQVVTADSMPTVFVVEDTAPPPKPPPPTMPAVAQMKFPLARTAGEHQLGRLVADARRNGVRAHFAIVSSETIAADLPAGSVTRDDLAAVLPADLSLVRLTLTGEELRAVLEYVVAAGDPIAHVAGLEVWYDPGRDEGRRIRSVRFPDGRDVRDSERYTLATSTSLFDGTAGFSTVQWLPRENVETSDVEALVAYLRRLRQPVEAPPANRFHTSR